MTQGTPVERLSGLIEAAAAVVGEVDLDNVLRRLVSEAKVATGARYAALGVIGPHGVLTDFIHEGLDDEAARRIGALPRGRGVLGTVVREQKTIVVDRISGHPDSYGFPEAHPPMTTFLGVPLRVGNSAFGNLYLTDKDGGFTQEDVVLVEALARIAGSAVSTARLRERLSAIAVVEDRDRIARDLHDSIIQDLFAIGLSIQGLSSRVEDKASSAILDVSVDRLDNAVEALRAYIYELKTSEHLKTSFDDQVSDLIDRMSSAYPTTVNLTTHGISSDLDPRITEEALKLVTEALSNSLRHATATAVSVSATHIDNTLSIRVDDDGQGFDSASVEHGLGLLNMAERARRLGGGFDLETSPGLGTRISIQIPTN